MYNMSNMKGNGTQKEARLARLKNEIVEYVATQQSCSAADIVHPVPQDDTFLQTGVLGNINGYFLFKPSKGELRLCHPLTMRLRRLAWRPHTPCQRSKPVNRSKHNA